MNYIIYDLEWNQPSARESTVTDPFCLEGEIIEIGAVKLNDAFKPVDEFKVYISPVHYKKMHHAVASLTRTMTSCWQRRGFPFLRPFGNSWTGVENLVPL